MDYQPLLKELNYAAALVRNDARVGNYNRHNVARRNKLYAEADAWGIPEADVKRAMSAAPIDFNQGE